MKVKKKYDAPRMKVVPIRVQVPLMENSYTGNFSIRDSEKDFFA